jgi:hypothetical protein
MVRRRSSTCRADRPPHHEIRCRGGTAPKSPATAFIYQLRAAGYDGVLSIEQEDALDSASERAARAAALLKRGALVETPDGAPADI